MMGWTGSEYFGTGSRKDFLIQEFTQENNTHKWYLSDISMRGAVAYCIHWVEDKTTGEKKHEGMVILTEKRKNDGHWIYHKAMGETVMPYYFDAPKRLVEKLNKLGEPYNAHARDWRERCLKNSSAKKVKVSFGQTIKFAKAFRFPKIGLESDTFTYTQFGNKRNIFTSAEGQLVCIPSWQKKEFTLVGANHVQ